jgi:hypothetical protein
LKPAQLTKRIRELSEKLKPAPSEGIKIDFYSFTEPEQLVLLKNFELDDKYRSKWTHEVIIENKELILKGNRIIMTRAIELFQTLMLGALMLDEIEASLFRLNFSLFLERWLECQKRVSKWTEKDREIFRRDTKITESMKRKREVKSDGKENDN